jgi:hypothetical protein
MSCRWYQLIMAVTGSTRAFFPAVSLVSLSRRGGEVKVLARYRVHICKIREVSVLKSRSVDDASGGDI